MYMHVYIYLLKSSNQLYLSIKIKFWQLLMQGGGKKRPKIYTNVCREHWRFY